MLRSIHRGHTYEMILTSERIQFPGLSEPSYYQHILAPTCSAIASLNDAQVKVLMSWIFAYVFVINPCTLLTDTNSLAHSNWDRYCCCRRLT